MIIEKKSTDMNLNVRLSTLWIIVAINVAMADILGITLQMMSGSPSEFKVSQVAMLVFAIETRRGYSPLQRGRGIGAIW